MEGTAMTHWKPSDEAYLRRHYRDMTAAAIAEALGRTITAVAQKAHKLHLTKEMPNKIRLTREQQAWLMVNYPHISTSLCAMHLNISQRSVVRFARQLGVTKTKTFMLECQRFAARRAKESHLRNGTYPPKGVYSDNLRHGEKYQFKPGIKS